MSETIYYYDRIKNNNTMKKLSKTYKELGIAFTFPIEIKDGDGKLAYYETSDGYWSRCEYDEKGNQTYYENSDGDTKGNKRDSCAGKVIEVDGKKYKLTEL
jgi:hypothetical protein